MGYIYDVEIDFENGKIKSVIIPKRNRLIRFFSKKKDYVIPWEKIVKVGREVVLVQSDEVFVLV